ncbi:MAG: C1 family peptidase [Aerococcus sp.]|nr:C1 family peptidase [Aerococcus sp.]
MLTKELLKKYKDQFNANPANLASAHAIAENGINKSSIDLEVKRQHTFSFSEETKHGEITNQKRSGRCWMFSALNTARVHTMSEMNVENFEFSQNYPLFWDKLEKSNYFLTSIIETVEEPQDSRLIWHLLQAPIEDGGQWEMFAGLLHKYGAVPKSIMPETFHSSNTISEMNNILTDKLREFASVLRKMYQNGATTEELEAKRDEQLYFVYQYLVKTLGPVPEKFDYAYRDKDDNFHKIEGITPQEFFQQYGGIDVEHMVSLINAPTADKPYHKTYTVQYLGSAAEERPVKYLNVEIDEIKQAAIRAIKDGKPVWFGCDVTKLTERDSGIMDMNIFAYKDTLGETFEMTKAERLDYSVSMLTHAMVLSGVDLDENGQPLTWKVENSWGDKVGHKGFYSMSDEWFDEYTYQITVPEKYVTEEELKEYGQEPIQLKPWDPMGALAWNK